MAEGGGRKKLGDTKNATRVIDTSSKQKIQDKKNLKSKGHFESKLEKLKNVVIRILKKHPEGVPKNDIWNTVFKETGREVSARDYGVSKMGRVFEKWSDVIKISGSAQEEILVLMSEQNSQEKQTALDADVFPALGKEELMEKAETATHRYTVSPLFVIEAEKTKKSQTFVDVEKQILPSAVSDQRKAASGSFGNGTFQTPDVSRQNWMQQIEGDIDDHVNKSRHNVQVDSDIYRNLEHENEDDTEGEEEEIRYVIDSILEESKSTGQPSFPTQRSMQSWMHIAGGSTLNTSQSNIPEAVKINHEESILAGEQTSEPAEKRKQIRMSSPHQGQPKKPAPVCAPPGNPTGLQQQPIMQIPAHQHHPDFSTQRPIQPGMPPPSFGNMGFATQNVNRVLIPAQGVNQLGMMFPFFNQSGMHITESSSLNITQPSNPEAVKEKHEVPTLAEEQNTEPTERREQIMMSSSREEQSRNSTPNSAPPGISTGLQKQTVVQMPALHPHPGVSTQRPIQSGMPPPGYGNMGFVSQGVNRYLIATQGSNQLGMMFPSFHQSGMPLLGMPLSYNRMQMPALGQFGISPFSQQIPAGLINQGKTKGDENVPQNSDLGGVHLQVTRQNETPSPVSSANSLLSPGTSISDASEETLSQIVMSEDTTGQMRKQSPLSPIEIPTSELNGGDKRVTGWTQNGKKNTTINEVGEPFPVTSLVEVQSQTTSEITKPIPAWTQSGKQEPDIVQVPLPVLSPSVKDATRKPIRTWTLIGKQDPRLYQVQMPSSVLNPVGKPTQWPNEQGKTVPTWTHIVKQETEKKQFHMTPSVGISALNMRQGITPLVAADQFKMPLAMPAQEKDQHRTPSIDWSKYDKPNLQIYSDYQGNILQSQRGLARSTAEKQPVINTIDRSGLDNWQPFSEDIKVLTVKPISKEEFQTTVLDVRPVYAPAGRTPPNEQVDSVVKECIEMLADANEYVTSERLEKLVLKRFCCNRIQDIGIIHVDKIPCVYELNRLISKINAFVIAFLKTRSICTLYELQENLREFVPGKGEFTELKTGPLQRFPVVFQQFRFPPDLAEIPEITTMDILDHFNNYLTQNNLWVNTKLEMEPFMNYLVQVYNADNAYMLGVRIRSLPLAITVLKKAKRDSGNSHRAIKAHFEENLKTDIGDAFRKFRANILHTGEGEGMEIRRHYLKMKPEFTIMEIFDKFNVLLMLAQERRLAKHSKFRRVIEDFLELMKEDELGRNILHLAICMSSTAVEEAVREMFTPANDDSEDENEKQLQHRPPPRKDALIESLKTYIERCLNAGAVSLTHLDRIEEKMLEDFGFPAFSMMGYGRFLEFLLKEAKQMLEESGGLLIGSASGGTESDSATKTHQTDLVEFIKQFKQQENIQTEQIEAALCAHYNVKDVRLLGHGNITRLLSCADKHGRHIQDSFTVFYESALLQSCRFSQSSNSKVGILGHQTRDAAKTCLHNCPLLENMADWSKWSLVFEPELGKLKDFVQKYGGVTTKTLDGGKVVTFDVLALELKPGELIKIVSSTSQENVAIAIKKRDIQSTTGHLVSMAVAYKGVENMPLALLSSHVTTALIQMHAAEPSGETTDPLVRNTAAGFVLQCLLRIPTKLCVSLANQLFLEPLGRVVGSSKSKQLLVQLCKTETELSHLLELGCLLGIQEWTDVIQRNCQLQDSDVQLLPSEVLEFFENDDINQEEEEVETSDESDREDVDEILAGEPDGDKDNTSETNKLKVLMEAKDIDTDVEISVEIEDTEKDSNDSENGPAKKEITSCEDIVNEIRRDEFGVGVHLSEDGQRLMKVQQERLGRSLDRLSKDLYSKDTHFVLELVQNADDNSYADELLGNTSEECPSVKFVIEDDGIYVYNNELGFREKDIRALCDVGRSTKGKHKFGYIGQKGIGFKSVFRITDSPEVHSNGYHMKFDVNSGPMGYILPHWIKEQDKISQNEWMTQIVLRLKPDMRLQTRTLAARFNDIHPSILLFLHRLREITIENKVESGVQTMRRRDIGKNVVEIQHTDGCDRWLVVRKMLDATKISLQTKSGADVESTELAIAFPLKHQGKKTIVQRMPPKQPVFAFLPLRSYGFRFIIQGDFDVPSSREDVDRDSPWNQWLRNEIHTVFIDSLDTFKNHPDFSRMDAVCAFLQFVPMEDEVLDFFKPVSSDILKKLKAKQCVPTQPDSQGIVSWKMPSQTARVRDPLVRSVITPDMLQTHLNLFYLHNDVACMLNSSLTSCLGIETLTCDHLFQLGKALIVRMGTHCSKEEDVVLISKWMACLYRSLDEFQHDDTILEILKTHRMLPLSDGELVSLQDKTVFYPIPNSSIDRKKGKDPLYYLQQDVKSLHPVLLNTEDDEVNSQVHKLLLRLGIKQLSPFDVINHHIIPVLKSDDWKSKAQGTLISYLVYIKEQVEKQPSVCNLDEVKDVAVVMTNHGFKNPSRETVHFPPQYGNQISLQEIFSGYSWTLLDACYLPQPCPHPMVINWQNFFRKLGVEIFLTFRKKDVHITREELNKSLWSSQSALWPTDEEEFTVQDYYSAELEGLIMENSFSDERFTSQMSHLFIYLDRNWDSQFSKYSKCHVLGKDGITLKQTDSSFSILLRSSLWLPAVETTTAQESNGYVKRDVHIVMKQPSDLYTKSDVVHQLLFDKVLYLNANTSGGSFCQFLGIRNSVDIQTVKDLLVKWGERKDEDSPAVFCTTLDHMKNVYKCLGTQLTLQELCSLLQEKPVFFVPGKNAMEVVNARGKVVPGKMLNKNEIWFMDKTGLFDKYRSVLEEFHSEICNKRTVAEFYSDSPEILERFKQEGKLDMQPKVAEYIELLCLLCNTCSPKDGNILSDVLYIFSTIGEILAAPPEGLPGGQATDSALKAKQTFVKSKLKRQKVFPTNKLVWVSLEDQPMIADNREWEKMFVDKEGVHFLDMEDKSTRISRKPGGRSVPRGYSIKILESRVKPEMINMVIEVCGIKKLSEAVDIRPTPEMIAPCLQLQDYFSQITPALQQYLMAKFEDVYLSLEQMNMKDILADAKFYQTGKLEVSYWIPSMPVDTFVIQQEKCLIHPPEFYFHRDHLTTLGEVASRETARYFSRGNTDCTNLLRSFLSELFNIISGVSEDTVEGLLQRHEADDIDIPDEEKWEVKAPVLPEPDKPEKQESEENIPDSEPATEKTNQNEGPFEIRAWPPVANPDRTQSRGTSEMPASNMWPPPAAKDYMKSVKDLPSNIRVVTADDNSKENISQSTDSVGKIEKTNVLADQIAVQGQGGGTYFMHNKQGETKSGQTTAGELIKDPRLDFVNSEIKKTQHEENKSNNAEVPQAYQGAQADSTKIHMHDHDEQHDKSIKSENTTIPEGHSRTKVQPNSTDDRNESPEKRKDMHVYRHHGEQPGDADNQFHERKQVITGAPFWSSMATDYSYDDLGSGRDLGNIESIALREGAGGPEIGRWGEALVAHYLQRQKELGNIKDYLWKNSEDETGCPYDFEIQLIGDDGSNVNYIEVKSTVSDHREAFEISLQQVKFSNQMKDSFHIYRVFNAGNPERVKLIRIKDLHMRLSTKQVKLCIVI